MGKKKENVGRTGAEMGEGKRLVWYKGFGGVNGNPRIEREWGGWAGSPENRQGKWPGGCGRGKRGKSENAKGTCDS